MEDDDHRTVGRLVELFTPRPQGSQQDSLLASVGIEDLERALVPVVPTDPLSPPHGSTIEPLRDPLGYDASIELHAASKLHLGPAYRDGRRQSHSIVAR